MKVIQENMMAACAKQIDRSAVLSVEIFVLDGDMLMLEQKMPKG